MTSEKISLYLTVTSLTFAFLYQKNLSRSSDPQQRKITIAHMKEVLTP